MTTGECNGPPHPTHPTRLRKLYVCWGGAGDQLRFELNKDGLGSAQRADERRVEVNLQRASLIVKQHPGQDRSSLRRVYHPLVRRIRFLSNLILLPHLTPTPTAFTRRLLRHAEHSVPGFFLFLIDDFVFYVCIYFWMC